MVAMSNKDQMTHLRIFFITLKLSPLIIDILSLSPILSFEISQYSFDKSIPVPYQPKFLHATRVEPIPLKGSITLEPFFRKGP